MDSMLDCDNTSALRASGMGEREREREREQWFLRTLTRLVYWIGGRLVTAQNVCLWRRRRTWGGEEKEKRWGEEERKRRGRGEEEEEEERRSCRSISKITGVNKLDLSRADPAELNCGCKPNQSVISCSFSLTPPPPHSDCSGTSH